jgi:hypothetical protein
MNYYTITTKTAVMPSTAVPRSGGVTTITVLNNKKKYSYRHELLHHHKKTSVTPSTAVPRSGGVTTITVLNNKIKHSYRHELLHHHNKNIVCAFNGRSSRAR